MPSVSRQQQKAMFAARSGHSSLGIPQDVGEEYAEADKQKARVSALRKKKAPAPAPHAMPQMP